MVAGILVAALLIQLTRRDTDTGAGVPADSGAATFGASYASGNWQVAVLDATRIDHDAQHPGCVDAVTSVVRSGAAATWSGDPVKVAVRTSHPGVVIVNSATVKIVSTEPAPPEVGALSCGPHPTGEPSPRDNRNQLSAGATGARPGDRIEAGDPIPEGVVKPSLEYSFEQADSRQFQLRTFVGDGDVVRWTLQLAVSEGGTSRVIDLDDGGHPFVTIGAQARQRPVTSRYEWDGAATENRVRQRPGETALQQDDFDLSAALESMWGNGPQPVMPIGPLPGPLRSLTSLCRIDRQERCWTVDLFAGKTPVGRIRAQLGELVSQDGASAVLEFPRYRPGDRPCCPSGPRTRHTVTLTGGQPRIEPPIPADPNNAAAVACALGGGVTTGPTRVIATLGDTPCARAVDIATRYYRDVGTLGKGSYAVLEVDDWQCSATDKWQERDGVFGRCERGGETLEMSRP
ncbi:hypothetical protein [Amycolatopsis sp. NPDC051071]|uniref:hypothetical protein n=1 Tax=Amycolatopsis sp. NPDC051071 TaxID=3154637 RepID=UPI003414B37C